MPQRLVVMGVNAIAVIDLFVHWERGGHSCVVGKAEVLVWP